MEEGLWQSPSCYALMPHRYYDLELPVSLKNGYFFYASQVQGHEHANVSKVLPHLLQGLTSEGGADVLMDLAIAWRVHQMLADGMFACFVLEDLNECMWRCVAPKPCAMP